MKASIYPAAVFGAALVFVCPYAAWAQNPTSLEPHQFIVYAYEDLVKTGLPSREALQKAPGKLVIFQAYQQHQADKLIFVLSRDEVRSADLIDRLEAYRKLLQKIAEVVKAVDASKKESFSDFVNATLKLKYEEVMGARAVTFSGIGYALNVYGAGYSPSDSFLMGAGAMAQKAIVAQIRVEAARLAALEAYREAVQKFKEAYSSLLSTHHEKIGIAIRALPLVDDKTIEALSEKYDWTIPKNRKEKDWESDEDRPRDPFLIERMTRARKIPDGLAGADQYLKNANDFLFASKLVPRGQDFVFYRTRLLALAGVAANKSCAAQVGTAGFSSINRSKRLKAAALAQTCWLAYGKLAGIPFDDRELSHQAILAYAYGSKEDILKARAYFYKIETSMAPVPVKTFWYVRLVASPNQPTNANFWYDAACLSGAMKQPDFAFKYLQTAVRLGFNKKVEASVNPDLDFLRTVNPKLFSSLIDSSE